jgi:hypothetical protein
MVNLKYILSTLFFCSMLNILLAQNIVLPINHDYKSLYEVNLHKIDSSNLHTAVQPYISKKIYDIADNSLKALRFNNTATKFGNLLFNDNLFNVQEEGNYDLTANLLLSFNSGFASDTSYGFFIRGAQVKGNIGDKVFYSSEVFYGNAVVPSYIVQQDQATRTFLGNGARRTYLGNTGLQESSLNATGQITYQHNQHFHFQLGHGQNFIGDGYRSLLLSDNSTFYPYFKATTNFWNIQYTNLYTSMIDFQSGVTGMGIYPRKYVTSHYLSWNITPRINIGLFETVIYQDSTNTRGFDVSYLNPVIFYRPIEYEIGSLGGNALVGASAKIKITNDLHLYGQVIVDELSLARIKRGDGCWCNRFGIQAGFKSFNTFIPNLTVQSEINAVNYYTYSHRTSLQNYSHSNLALAHPLGANFIESMSIIRYQKDRWVGKLQFMYAVKGLDTLGSHWGGDINLPYDLHERDFGNTFLQGVKTTITYTDINIGYIVNPMSNFNIELGYRQRGFNPETEVGGLKKTTDGYIYLGVRTNFLNWYYDY